MNLNNSLYEKLETLGRRKLSNTFYMRDFLYSEISNANEIPNYPNDPELAVENGKVLCERLLEPLQDAFGRLHIRSGYRSPDVNDFGNKNSLNCGSNEGNYGGHIWDIPNSKFGNGAMACVVIPAIAEISKNRVRHHFPRLIKERHSNLARRLKEPCYPERSRGICCGNRKSRFLRYPRIKSGVRSE